MANEPRKRFRPSGNRGQGLFLVLYALNDIGSTATKREVITFIQDAELYDITKHDLPPYENQNEPKYHTLLAWARKDAVLAGLMVQTNERDAWQISREGRDFLARTLKNYQDGKFDVRRCYLWTPKFKKRLVPTYEPSDKDAVRPEEMWQEYFEQI